jgi:hypothetical protein
MARSIKQPHPLYPEAAPYRVRLPGAIASDLAWPQDSDSFNCFGIFRTDGELLCAPTRLATAEGTHPLEAALPLRDTKTSSVEVESLATFPATAELVVDLRVFEFVAKWTSKQREQLDLQLGVRRTSLLGWYTYGNEPIYAIARGGVLALISAEKVRAVQRQGIVLTEID